jgi:hypothetical protein
MARFPILDDDDLFEKLCRDLLRLHWNRSLSSRFDGDAIDTQINEARDCITKHECQLATLLLNHVLRDKGERLSQRQRFRALTNLGAAALGSGKPETAAKFFLQALPLQPDDELARINEVFAFLLVDDHKNCHEKATTLRQEYPASPRLTALWLSSAPKDIPMSSLEGEINSVLRLEPEVSLALSRRALTELEFERASAYAATAAQFAPMWAQPHIVLAQVNLGKASEKPANSYSDLTRLAELSLTSVSIHGCAKVTSLLSLYRRVPRGCRARASNNPCIFLFTML